MTDQTLPLKGDDPVIERGRPGRRPTQIDWRTFLNPSEKADLEGLEKNARDLDDRRAKLSRAIEVLRTRAIQRRRYERATAAKRAGAAK